MIPKTGLFLAQKQVEQQLINGFPMSDNHVEIWNKCLSVIKDNVTEQGYKTWFEPIVPVSLSNNVLTLQVPTQFFYEYLEEHYIDHLRTAIKRFVGVKGKLAYTMPVDSSNSSGSITLPSSNRNFPKNPIGQPESLRHSWTEKVANRLAAQRKLHLRQLHRRRMQPLGAFRRP